MQRVALITGITGQDGIYLSRQLVRDGYRVVGIKRRSSSNNTARMENFLGREVFNRIEFIHGDMTDASSLMHAVDHTAPDIIFNLAAQSHVAVSFEEPEYTANSDALGPLRLLEAMRMRGAKNTRFYQASTSEMFGNSKDGNQSELTPLFPASPYGAAKLYGYWITRVYRDSYKLFASNGILFNHESPMRSDNFVSQKVVKGFSRWKSTGESFLLGNLDSRRDWGHADDYVSAMRLIVDFPVPDDFVIATGVSLSVREFVQLVAQGYGVKLDWNKLEDSEECRCLRSGKLIFRTDERYYRPTDVNYLEGDFSKASQLLKWKPRISIHDLIEDMISWQENGVESEKCRS